MRLVTARTFDPPRASDSELLLVTRKYYMGSLHSLLVTAGHGEGASPQRSSGSAGLERALMDSANTQPTCLMLQRAGDSE